MRVACSASVKESILAAFDQENLAKGGFWSPEKPKSGKTKESDNGKRNEIRE
jgi:hypothetical protein